MIARKSKFQRLWALVNNVRGGSNVSSVSSVNCKQCKQRICAAPKSVPYKMCPVQNVSCTNICSVQKYVSWIFAIYVDCRLIVHCMPNRLCYVWGAVIGDVTASLWALYCCRVRMLHREGSLTSAILAREENSQSIFLSTMFAA